MIQAILTEPPSPPTDHPSQRDTNPSDDSNSNSAVGRRFDQLVKEALVCAELATNGTGIPHPLCPSCTSRMNEALDREIELAERDIRAYEAAVTRLSKDDESDAGASPDPLRETNLARQCAELDRECDAEERKIAELERTWGELEQQLQIAREAEKEVAETRDMANLLLAKYQLGLRAHLEERDALLVRIAHMDKERERLSQIKPLTDAFHIWYAGPFGTISGFRLGRTSEIPVPWDEVNAAWGQCALLLRVMAGMWGFNFKKHRILPLGCTSCIMEGPTSYPLYGPPKVKIGVSLAWRYDHGMVCFLNCLKEFATFLADHCGGAATTGKPKGSSGGGSGSGSGGLFHGQEGTGGTIGGLELPFPIDGDRINGTTIRLSLNREKTWTQALKYMLANLKATMHWMLEMSGQPGGGPA